MYLYLFYYDTVILSLGPLVATWYVHFFLPFHKVCIGVDNYRLWFIIWFFSCRQNNLFDVTACHFADCNNCGVINVYPTIIFLLENGTVLCHLNYSRYVEKNKVYVGLINFYMPQKNESPTDGFALEFYFGLHRYNIDRKI